MTIAILHGTDGHAGIHWQQWLHDELIKKGHTVRMPTLPHANHPNRSEWLQSIRNVLKDVDLSQLVIVGHSLGVPAALDFIEQSPSPINTLISISGFSDNYGSEYNDYFMKLKTVDFKKVRDHLKKSIVIYSDSDPYVPQKSLQLLAKDLNVEPLIIKNGGHFNSETEYKYSFPLLLKLISEL